MSRLQVLFGDNVRAVRTFQDLSTKDLARRAGMSSASYISAIERGEKNVRFDTVEKIAKALGVRPELLIGARLVEDDVGAELRRRGDLPKQVQMVKTIATVPDGDEPTYIDIIPQKLQVRVFVTPEAVHVRGASPVDEDADRT